MTIQQTTLPGVHLIKPFTQADARGSFTKPFHAGHFAAAGLATAFRESYYSVSEANVLRGMHLQLPPHQHAKLVYVVAGAVLDVALDLRLGPTYGHYESFSLSARRPQALYLPAGCAHGFLVLEAPAIMVYMTTTVYEPAHDTGIRWNSFGMAWPTPNPILSARDEALLALADFQTPFV